MTALTLPPKSLIFNMWDFLVIKTNKNKNLSECDLVYERVTRVWFA